MPQSDITQFSVIIPSYNYARYLPRAIDSVLAQQSAHWTAPAQIVVVDDGSTDETPAVLSGYASRVLAIRQNNAGVAVARNTGIAAATGEYFVFLDADDCLLPGALDTFSRSIALHPAAGLHAGRHRSIGTQGEVTESSRLQAYASPRAAFLAFIERRFTLSNGTVAWRRDLFDGVRYPAGVTHGEDVAVTGLALARTPLAVSDECVADIFAHGARARNQVDRMLRGGLAPVQALFEHPLLPPELRVLKPRFTARWLASLAGAAWRAKRYVEARTLYAQAFRAYWPLAFQLRHAVRYVRCWLGRPNSSESAKDSKTG